MHRLFTTVEKGKMVRAAGFEPDKMFFIMVYCLSSAFSINELSFTFKD